MLFPKANPKARLTAWHNEQELKVARLLEARIPHTAERPLARDSFSSPKLLANRQRSVNGEVYSLALSCTGHHFSWHFPVGTSTPDLG